MKTILVQVGKATGISPAGNAVPRRVSEAADRLGLKLTPQFGDTDDPELCRYFVAEAPAALDAESAAQELRGLSEVDAAYVQPEASPPSL